MGDAYVSRPLKKESKGDNFNLFKLNPYLVKYVWKALLNQKIMTLGQGFCDIPGRNRGLSKLTSCLTKTDH